jgi:hypothetical protein
MMMMRGEGRGERGEGGRVRKYLEEGHGQRGLGERVGDAREASRGIVEQPWHPVCNRRHRPGLQMKTPSTTRDEPQDSQDWTATDGGVWTRLGLSETYVRKRHNI